MNNSLSVSDIRSLLDIAEGSFRDDDCITCECYLGYLAQLEIDSEIEGREFLKDHKPPREEIHACLGCDPCAPGILYTNYLRNRSKK
jgi:hypothetical protein